MYYISDYIKKVSYYTMKYELTAGREILMSSEMAPTDDNQIVFEPEWPLGNMAWPHFEDIRELESNSP